MSHLSPFRLSAPNLNSELSTTSSNPKKRRKNTQNAIQSQTTMQDLLPPPLSGYGDTIVASNPFDDCPSSMSSVNMVRNTSNMGLGPPGPGPGPGPGPNGMGGGGMPHMNMCRPMSAMGSPLGMGSPMMHSPNGMQNNHGHGGHGHSHAHMLSQPMMINGPRMNAGPPPPGSMGGHMGGHMSHNGPPMLNSPNVNMNVNGPMGSPMHVNPMNSPLGPNMNGAPMNSGPNMSNPMGSGVGVMSVNGLNGPGCPGPPPPPPHVSVSQQMNGPMGNPMAINSVAGGPMVMFAGPHGPPMNNNFMMGPMGALYPKPMPVSAGKVYPADQPMVFNSQNPNAPPIYPCGVCHKEVHDNDQAILCESGCNFWFHRGCTGLTEAAFQLLTAEVYAEWVCDKCLNTKNIPVVKFKP